MPEWSSHFTTWKRTANVPATTHHRQKATQHPKQQTKFRANTNDLRFQAGMLGTPFLYFQPLFRESSSSKFLEKKSHNPFFFNLVCSLLWWLQARSLPWRIFRGEKAGREAAHFLSSGSLARRLPLFPGWSICCFWYTFSAATHPLFLEGYIHNRSGHSRGHQASSISRVVYLQTSKNRGSPLQFSCEW